MKYRLLVLGVFFILFSTLQAKHPVKTMVNAGPDIAFCKGDSVLLFGAGAATYSWTPTTGLSSPNTALTWAKPNTTTQYILYGTDASGNITMDTVMVTVFIPVIVDAGFGQTICLGDSVSLLAQTPVPVPTYLWSPAATLTDPTIANPNACPTDTTLFSVTITDANGCSSKDSVLITLLFSPIQLMSDTFFCPNDTVFLWASGGISYNWQPTLNMNDPFSPTPFVFPALDTTYYITISDSIGCSKTDSVAVTLFPEGVVDAGRDTAIYCRDTIQLFGSGGLTYEWVPGGYVIPYNVQNPIATPWWTTNYVMIATDANGCIWTDDVLITLIDHQLDVNILQPDTVICPGDTLQLDATTSHPVVSYNWYPPEANFSTPNQPSTLVNPPNSMLVGIWVEDSIHCKDLANRYISLDTYAVQTLPDSVVCEGQTVQLLTNGALTFHYTWTPDIGLSGNAVPEPHLVASQSVTYLIEVIDSLGCYSSDQVTLTVNPKPDAYAGPDKEMCEGSSVSLEGSGSANVSFIWNPFVGLNDPFIASPVASPTNSTLYTLTVISPEGCQAKDEMYVKVNPNPVISISPNNVTLCQGDTVSVQANGAATTFQWSPPIGLSDAATSNPQIYPSQSTNYTIIGSSNGGCGDTAYLSITVNPTPIPVISAPEGVCQNRTDTLSVIGGNSFLWSTGATTAAIPITPITDTWYFVTSFDAFTGCGGLTDSVWVKSWAVPEAQLSYSIPALFSPVQALFFNQSTGAEAYDWHFMPDDVTVYDINPVYDFSRNGEHIVTLTAISHHGCQDSVTQRIYLERPTLFIPSAFSPNGDTYVDSYYIGTYGVESAITQIYDRWGREVFYSDNKDFQWDGKDKKGQDLPEGTYIIKVNAKKLNGISVSEEGTITLIR